MVSQLWAADFGSLMWHVYCHNTGQFFSFTPEEFLRLNKWLPAGSRLIIEAAHAGTPRSDYSLAQVYDAQTLLKLYEDLDNHNCTLELFPQGLTPKARASYDYKDKTDQNDLVAMCLYVVDHPEMSMKKPPKTFITERRREAGWTFKKENDGILNVARRFGYKKAGDFTAEYIQSRMEALASRLSPEARAIMMLDDSQRNSRTKTFKKTGEGARISRLYTLTALFLHPKGYVRKRPDTNQMPGVEWLWRYVLNMSPYHFRGGIARSNLNWHAFRNYAIGEMNTRKAGPNGKVLSHYHFDTEQQEDFRALRKTFKKAVMETMQVVRDMVQADMREGVLQLER